MTAYALTDTVSVDNVVQISGSVTVAGITLSASFPSSLTVDQGTGDPSNPWFVTTTGSLPVTLTSPLPLPVIQSSSLAIRTVVSASLTTVTLLNANSARRGAIFFNDSTSVMYLALGPSGSLYDYTDTIAGGTSDDLDFGYQGVVTAVWLSPVGQARVTEIT